MSEPLYLDIETIPAQSSGVKDEIREPLVAAVDAKCVAFEQEIGALKPPGNLKDPEKIKAWEATERPKKEAALRACIEQERGKLEATFEAAWRRTSFDGALGQVVCISWALGKQKPSVVHAGKEWPKLASEAAVLNSFFKSLQEIPQGKQSGLVWVGHWINEFDLRFIYQRAVIHGIRPPHFIPFNRAAWDDRVFDTMVMWAGNRGKVTLDKLCRVLGVSGKGIELAGDDIDGSKVWDFVRDGKIEEVAQYCVGDVERVREVHQRMTFGGGA